MIKPAEIQEIPSPHPANQESARPIDTSGIFPSGRLRETYRHVQPAVEWLLGFPALCSRYDACRADDPDAVTFSRRFLEASGVDMAIEAGLETTLRVVEGPLVVAANHPFGGIDFFTLVSLLESVRPGGWKFLANPAVCRLPGFQDTFIPLDPLDPSVSLNRRGLAAAARHLGGGGLLGLFPAGRVSHRDSADGAITDRPWSDHTVRLAASADASLAVLNIPGSNSQTFLRVPPCWPRFRALMLARELARPPVSALAIRLARLLAPSDVQRLAQEPHPGLRLQAWCHLRADRARPLPLPHVSSRKNAQPETLISPPAPPESRRTSASALRASHSLLTSGPFELLFVRGDEAPVLLHELGRIREITFRAAGQGTGNALDLSSEDSHYHHLLLWDREAQCLAGAYRVGIVQDILAAQGPQGLYLDHVFKIRPAFFHNIGPAFELSRSFVLPDYQRDNRALAALWKGLGTAAVRHGIRTFFGSVTISNAHHPATRAILVEHLRSNYADSPSMCRLIHPRNPFVPAAHHHTRIANAYLGEPLDRLAPLIDVLEEGRRSIPPLMRYYCSLGAKFLAYHVEPAFADALYCLLRVDLPSLPPAYRRRFVARE